jgi:hypothetical protein
MKQLLQSGTPKPGDIILQRINGGSRRYALSTSARVPQILCSTYDEALAEAGRCARAHRLDVWETDDQLTFSCVVECRHAR